MRSLFAILAATLLATPAAADRVTVFAASSLKNALHEIADGFNTATGHDAVLSLAGSSALARQIQMGAPADVFISANVAWMDAVQVDGLIDTASRIDLVGNQLVLIGHTPAAVQISADLDLAALLGDGHLSMALVRAVPAGIYGKAALQNLGLWDSVASRVAQADNARAALALVSLGQAPLGVVYATDAQADARVHVLAQFPADSHPAITYPAAALSGAGIAAFAFLSYLQGDAAQAVFARHGFLAGGH